MTYRFRWPLRRCRHVYRWRTGFPDNRCTQATLTGLCVPHRLERYRWELDRPHLLVHFDLSNINRPLFSVDEDRPHRYIALSWGNGNSDPVLLIELRRRLLPPEGPV